ncbi:SMC5-SMC6 complex localization factor protein 2 isoform X3 [Pseudonaja textilis]|uniref:SMC5-SMC6 complex localization factor protein 2 isoform X3 n=1 Tax=Pseudonaja textilis TaxID=8673 RepID=UPI000EA8B112|nr:SMC5-SMC6 complex localization factor protein 2 isoform X3 [Pseudonaja textilis]
MVLCNGNAKARKLFLRSASERAAVFGNMTQNCSGSGSYTELSVSACSPSQHRPSVDRGAADTRSKCITDFFKPTLKKDRTVMCSPEKGNGRAGHTDSCVGHVKKNTSSSKQHRRKKLPCSPSGRSPIIDALFQKAKSEKNNSSENSVNHPKPVVRRLFISKALPDGSFILKDPIYSKNLERNEKYPVQTRTHLMDNSSRQHKAEYEDLDSTGSSLNKWPFTSGNNSLKKQSHVTQCQKTVYSRLPQVSSSSAKSLGTVRKKSKEKGTKDFLRKNSSSTSLESSSDESSSAQTSKSVFCSGLSSDKTIVTKSQPSPTAYSSATTSFGIANHKHPRKRKRISSKTNVKNVQYVQKLNKHKYGSSQIPHNTNYSKHRISAHNSQPADTDLSSSNLPISVEKSEAEENENKSYRCIISKNNKIQISDTSKRKLQTSTPLIYLETRRYNASTVPSKKIAEPLKCSVGESETTSETTLEDYTCDTIPNSSCNLNKSNNETYELIQKLKSISDSDAEVSDCSVNSSEEETLIPLEKILFQSVRPPAKRSEEAMHEDEIESTISATHNASLSKAFTERGASYMNHLEHLLKEKEELRRDQENQLQHVKEGVEINSEPEDQSTGGELFAEQREFIEKYSFSQDAIPDQHPGENIFQIGNAGKIFSQNNLDLRNFDFHPQNLIEKYLLRSGITQQLFVTIEGLLASTYHNCPCPVPILKWMFQMMSIHPDSTVSRKILDTLMLLTIRNFSDKNDKQKPWIPSLFDITTVLINMGISFNVLFPLQHFQPGYTENDIMSEMHVTVNKQSKRDICINPTTYFLLIESNLCNIAKFLQLCINVCPEGYTDREIFLLLLLLSKLSLETQLKQFPLVDLECLVIKLLENIRNWDTEMSQLSLAISCLSNHHHNLLWLVQFVPNWTTRGRQIRRHLSLVIISKILKSHVKIPSTHDHQMSLLCKELVKMKPSGLLKRLSETSGHDDGVTGPFLSESEHQAYYLTYVLLHLVREASNFERTSSNKRKWLLRLCSILEKHVKCDIREDVRLFYRTKVKDLVARTYSKWQQMIHSSQLIQGQIHDFWVPDT